MTMPLDIVVAPLTLAQTVEVACAAPADAADAGDAADDGDAAVPFAIPAMPAVELEPVVVPGAAVGVPVPAPFAAEDADAAVVVGCEVASTTVVAESTSTAATPTVLSATHHIRAAGPRPDQRCVTRCLRRSMTPPRRRFTASIDPRCQERANRV
jgi:hypothetical protein